MTIRHVDDWLSVLLRIVASWDLLLVDDTSMLSVRDIRWGKHLLISDPSCICILIVSMHAVEPRNFLNSVLLDAIVIVMMNFDMIFNDFT